MITNTHVTLQSNNRKTGPITTTGRPRATCPTTCTFNPENPEGVGGCYTVGRIDSMYRRYARDWEYQELREFLVDSKTDRLRDRVDGDVLTDGEFDREYLNDLETTATASQATGNDGEQAESSSSWTNPPQAPLHLEMPITTGGQNPIPEDTATSRGRDDDESR